MSQVEQVALWAGLLGSVVGIVLSVVAIWFTWVVNKRADKISDHTIQSLQKIESTVSNLSENTNSLIKNAWEKMLGNVATTANTPLAAASMRELAAGVAAELRDELGLVARDAAQEDEAAPTDERVLRLERSLERLEATIQNTVAAQGHGARGSALIDVLLPILGDLSPLALELVLAIRNRHLTLDQYRKLRQSTIGPAVMELRDFGLLAPFAGVEGGKKERVYFIPHGFHRSLGVAGTMLPRASSNIQAQVREELSAVGYVGKAPPRN